nr:ergosterol biosynthetic protein 28 homolog isoform X3 [Manis javanica]
MAHVDPGPQLSWRVCKPPGLLCFGSGLQISRVVGRKERQKALSGLREVMSRFLNVLRSWLVMVSIIAMGNTLQSFRDHTFLYEKLYTGKPNLVNGLQARTFGIWTLLSSVIRCLCAIDIHNKTSRNCQHLRSPQCALPRQPPAGSLLQPPAFFLLFLSLDLTCAVGTCEL